MPARETPLPVREVVQSSGDPAPDDAWYRAIPAVRQVLERGWELAPVTVLVGDNGAGKSTLVEALAMAFGLGGEGGSTGARHQTRATESGLWQHLTLRRGAGAARNGYFLRAETMHGLYTYLEANPSNARGRPEPSFHEMSHGESFLSLVTDRMRWPGLYVLDEPESALSFTGCLGLVGHLHALVQEAEAQVVLSTHSPVLAALPGAEIWEVGDWGLRRSPWAELDLVTRWQGFLDDPQRYLRHVLDP